MSQNQNYRYSSPKRPKDGQRRVPDNFNGSQFPPNQPPVFFCRPPVRPFINTAVPPPTLAAQQVNQPEGNLRSFHAKGSKHGIAGTYKYNQDLKVHSCAFDEFYEVTFFISRRQVEDFCYLKDFLAFSKNFASVNVVDIENTILRQPTTLQKVLMGLFLCMNNDIIVHCCRKSGLTNAIALGMIARVDSVKRFELEPQPKRCPIGIVIFPTLKAELRTVQKVYSNISSRTDLVCSHEVHECDILISHYHTLKNSNLDTSCLKFVVVEDADVLVTDTHFRKFFNSLVKDKQVIKIFSSTNWTEDKRDSAKPLVDDTALLLRVYSM